MNQLRFDDFRDGQGDGYLIYFTDSEPMKATLIEVGVLGADRKDGVLPFCLVFETEQLEAYYTQGTFRVVHGNMKDRDYYIFLVPIGFGNDSGKARYEAVVN